PLRRGELLLDAREPRIDVPLLLADVVRRGGSSDEQRECEQRKQPARHGPGAFGGAARFPAFRAYSSGCPGSGAGAGGVPSSGGGYGSGMRAGSGGSASPGGGYGVFGSFGVAITVSCTGRRARRILS